MRILIAGSSGLIGRALIASLESDGHSIVRLIRSQTDSGPVVRGEQPPKPPHAVTWKPEIGKFAMADLERFDAIINLAGAGIADRRWTENRKREIHDSRVQATNLLAQAIARLKERPKVFVTASAIGIYGDRGDEELTEDAWPGNGFLSDVCVAWERSARPAADAGARVVHPRIGVVLTRNGGALAAMLLPFQLGFGGLLGSGKQFMSCISLDDVVRVLKECVTNQSLRGPVNAVMPHAVTNADFTHALGRALGRPTIVPVPAFALRMVVGEMADALLLASIRVKPQRLLEAGFQFHQPDIESALRHALK